jgi:uncharacterized membrane protein
MDTSKIYLVISVIILIALLYLTFFPNKYKEKRKMTPLGSLAFGFVIAGIIFGDDRLMAYSLVVVGVILAIIDIFRQKKLS